MNECRMLYDARAGVWTCSECGRTVKADAGTIIHASCRQLPNPLTRMTRYAHAIYTHVTTGAQTRSDEEVQNLLTICQSCDKYNRRRESCLICGCKCNMNKSAFLNKLRMKSQSCPAGKWAEMADSRE